MSVTIIEKYQIGKSGKISIKPYFDSSISNMGLENYQMSLMDGVYHEEQLACLELNGIKRYVTGLNEFAPEVKMLPADEKAAKIREIREVVASLEQDLAANVIDPESKMFWKEVTLLKPDNDEFWSRISLRCGNDPVFLDPIKDPYDLIKLYAIEAGGFSIVSKSLEAAGSRATPPKFFLDKLETTAANRTSISKLRNQALSQLQKLFDKQPNKLFLVSKVVDANSTQYTKNTPNDILYENMDNYINGFGVDKDKKKTAQIFLDASRLDMETLKLKAIVKDATQYRMITTKSDGMIYDLDTGSALGRTPSDVVAFLKNPLNEEVMVKLMSNVEGMWNS